MTDQQNPNAFSVAVVPQGIESAATAVASQAKAMVESRYVMAMRNPRNWDQVRTDLIMFCVEFFICSIDCKFSDI